MIAIYVRVSTNRQAETGVSLEMQKEKLTAYCKIKDLGESVEIFADEGFSGRNLNRPALSDALEWVRTGEVEHFVVYSLSRFSRNTRETLELLQELKDRNVTFHSFSENLDTSSIYGEFVMTILSALAQMESQITSERITEAHAARKRNGGRMGQMPFGKMLVDGLEVDDPEEQKTIKRMKFLRKQMKLSYNNIAKQLNKEGRKTKNEGGRWYDNTVATVLKREMKR